MSKVLVYTLGALGAAALAGGAIAAGQQTHRMDVPLPDGGVVHVEYVGDVAPNVTVAPSGRGGMWEPMAFPGFGNFNGMFEQMDRQMRQIQETASAPGGINVASYGSMPEGSSSVSVVSTSNGSSSCTRTTEVVSQGAGKPPKITNSASGDCGGATKAPREAAPTAGAAPIDHT